MAETYTVSLAHIAKEAGLKTVWLPEGEKGDLEKILISTPEINRPALQLAGFFDYFDPKRIQVVGKVEATYIAQFSSEVQYEKFERLFSYDIPAIVVAHNITPNEELMLAAKKHNIPVFGFEETASNLTFVLVNALNLALAPRETRHGVLVEVYGEGILMIGDSGIGKSETATELLKRGHRLVADDAVEIKRASNKTLFGSSPEVIRHLIELRGIGIVDVRRIFGVGAVKETAKIDLVIQMEKWDDSKQYERLGLDEEYYDILGLKIPTVTIPIQPGRNLAIIIEVAAMNNRQRRLGYNAAAELNKRLMESMGIDIQ